MPERTANPTEGHSGDRSPDLPTSRNPHSGCAPPEPHEPHLCPHPPTRALIARAPAPVYLDILYPGVII